jgi:hypothetical protein
VRFLLSPPLEDAIDRPLPAQRQSTRLKEKIEKGEQAPLYAELDAESRQEGEKLIFKTTDPTSDDIEAVGDGSSWTGDHLHQLGVDLPNERIDLDADVIHTDQFHMSPELQKRILPLFCCFDTMIRG